MPVRVRAFTFPLNNDSNNNDTNDDNNNDDNNNNNAVANDDGGDAGQGPGADPGAEPAPAARCGWPGGPPGSPRVSEAENEPDEIPGPIRPGGPRGGAAAGAGSRVGAPKCTFAHILLYSTLAAPGTRHPAPGNTNLGKSLGIACAFGSWPARRSVPLKTQSKQKPWNCARVWFPARAAAAQKNTP